MILNKLSLFGLKKGYIFKIIINYFYYFSKDDERIS